MPSARPASPSCASQSSRRKFLGDSVCCGAWMAALATLSPVMTGRVFAQTSDNVVTREKWGRIEKIADNMWALVSTLEDRDFTTVCNGGIVAADDGVLAIESCMTPAGARWMAEWAERLTGRWPTDVVITHYHADHSAGTGAYYENARQPRLWVTEATEQQIRTTRPETELPDRIQRIDASGHSEIDLGNRKISLVPRSGHTRSDVSVEISDPNIIWAGDLFFNQMVPNYSDSLPSELERQVADLVREKETVYVPGHGPIADAAALGRYRDFLAVMREAARRTWQAGEAAEAAGKSFELPAPFGDWFIYAPEVMPNAFSAWYRQFEADRAAPDRKDELPPGSTDG